MKLSNKTKPRINKLGVKGSKGYGWDNGSQVFENRPMYSKKLSTKKIVDCAKNVD